MDAKVILLLLTIVGCSTRQSIPGNIEPPREQYLDAENMPPQITIYTNGVEYWGLRFPEPATQAANVIKNHALYTNIIASNKLIMLHQATIISNSKVVIKNTKRQRRRSTFKWVAIVGGTGAGAFIVGMIVQFFRGFVQ